MALVKNITTDPLSLFSVDAPPVLPGDTVTVRDEAFVERAWPSTVWEVVEPPALEGFTEVNVEDAHLWSEHPTEPEQGEHLDAPSFEVLSVAEPVEVVPEGPLPVEGALPDEQPSGDQLADPYDPAEHTVAEVVTYLASADQAERTRVIEAEAAGKARKTITEWSE